MSEEIDIQDVPDIPVKEKTKLLTVRVGSEEKDMIKALKGSPHFINISEYLRASIHHLYDKRVNGKK
jgi:Arc/MetJ-type ribon-helix-helix transcriptional regulator